MKICISRIDKMGDMILTLPIIKSIKIHNPDTEIHILSSKKNTKVLSNIKYIDKIFEIDSKKFSFIKDLNEVRKIKYDYFINFSPNIKSYFLCFFSKSYKKATLILLSRYKKNIFSKIFIRLFSLIFCSHINLVDRNKRLNLNQEIHQTKMMFDLLKKCKIQHNQNIDIEINLPKEKINFQKKTVIIHLSDKWINNFYSEINFLELIKSIENKNYLILMTTDQTTKNKFSKIFLKYKVIQDLEKYHFLEKNNILILEDLKYKLWLQAIYSSDVVITPECGCSHIAAACKIPVNIIYDANNYPDAIYREYHPWNNIHKKFISNDKNLNNNLLQNL